MLSLRALTVMISFRFTTFRCLCCCCTCYDAAQMRPLRFDERLDFDDCFSVGAMPCADMGHIVHKCLYTMVVAFSGLCRN